MNKKLKDLLPDELEKIKSLIDSLLIELGIQSQTNKRYLLKEKNIKCPQCQSKHIHKNGTKNNTQRFKCLECNKFFSITTSNVLSYSKLSYQQLIKLLECMGRYETLEATAKETGISERQTYNLRIKIISLFNKFDNHKLLSGVVQADEKYIRLSFKGTRKKNMPRKSRKNGNGYFQNRGSGINKNEHVCVVCAIDSEDKIILKIVGMGIASTEMIELGLSEKIVKGSTLITDSKNSYIEFAIRNKLNLKQIPSGETKTEDYHLGELNEIFTELEILLLRFKGLSTRHLQEYLDWFRYRKILKYTVDYLKTTKEFFKIVLKEESVLTNNDVCKREMPIDISKIKFKN